jgi:hypothetical protein
MRTISAVALFCLASLGGCAALKSNTPAAELFDCRAAALEPILGSREAAVAAAREIYAGRKSLTKIVEAAAPALKDVRAAVQRLLSDLQACEPVVVTATPDAGAAVEGEVAQ